MVKIIIFFVAFAIGIGEGQKWALVGNPLLTDRPCNGTEDISISYEPGKPPEEENVYSVFIDIKVPVSTKLVMEFDSEATVKLSNYTASKSRIRVSGEIFTIHFFYNADFISFNVRGPLLGTVPYFKSLKINGVQYCENPKVGYLDRFISGYQDTAATELKIPEGCGRRKVQHTELIVNGEATKAGDWPWHVAIYRLERSSIKYICGGTLISKTIVLTAAHCATVRGVPVIPEILSVVLGKYNLIGGDLESQEREIHSVIAHENFSPANYLENDIALLKLKTEATYNDYVQPACIWYSEACNRLPSNIVYGTVVGWGFDQSDALSSQLKQANMPKVADVTCLKKNPLFYANVLNNNKKFCAGWANGTSACNGDSGGGFSVFVPDTPRSDSASASGAWHVRGIVSLSASRKELALCDPNQYVVFTDVAKYTGWIKKHLGN